MAQAASSVSKALSPCASGLPVGLMLVNGNNCRSIMCDSVMLPMAVAMLSMRPVRR